MIDTELQTGEESESLETEAESAPAGETEDTEETQQSEGQETEGQEAEGQEGEGAPEGGVDDPAGFTKAINKKHFLLMEETRKVEALQQQLAQAQSQMPQVQRPLIPDLPDPYDADFDQKMQVRDKAVSDAAAYDATTAVLQHSQQVANQNAFNQQQEQTQKTEQAFVDRSANLGVNTTDLNTALQTVNAYGGVGDVAQYIMNDPKGPLIAAFLANNPGEIETLRNLGLAAAGEHIAINIKPKVAAMKKTTGAPAPVDSLDGGGAPPAKRGPEGATYE